MDTVEVIVGETDIVEVIQRGPQGISSGADLGSHVPPGGAIDQILVKQSGLDYDYTWEDKPPHQLPIQIETESLVTQVIPVLTGLPAGELEVDFGIESQPSVEVAGSLVTMLAPAYDIQAHIELDIDKAGGGTGELVVWAIISVDSGTTWFPLPTSIRRTTIPNTGAGIFTVVMSTPGLTPAGTMFKVKATNIGGSTLQFKKPDDIVTSDGTVGGKSAKLTMAYRVD